jgi:hypothetical protein
MRSEQWCLVVATILAFVSALIAALAWGWSPPCFLIWGSVFIATYLALIQLVADPKTAEQGLPEKEFRSRSRLSP